MAKTIYKYPLIITDIQELELPKCADILSVQTQRSQPCIWALVDLGATETDKYR